ncbi:MAG: alpha/beta hydrolase [Anaerolineales bacterium]|jgi:pimeloyl-ACP methyl ester carboxylesterase
MSAIILRGDIVHYEVLGRGRPIIFLHSWIGSWRYWVPSMQAASNLHRTYALDFWGYGDTAKNPKRYSLDEQVELLRSFLVEMGIVKIACIGHGLGAIIALLFAEKAPEMVDRIMAISLPSNNGMIDNLLEEETRSQMIDWLSNDSTIDEITFSEVDKADPQAHLEILENLQNIDLNSLTRRVDMPCLRVYGYKDQTTQTTEDGILNPPQNHVHTIIFEESGHFPMLDQASKFHRLMVRFLALNSGESPKNLLLKDKWTRRVR